eukprot:bmy_17030T0
MAEREITCDIKEQLYSWHRTCSRRCHHFLLLPKKSCEPPDGQVLTIDEERVLCPEALFQPSILGLGSCSIHETTFHSIIKGNVHIQKDLSAFMVLSGGTTVYPAPCSQVIAQISPLSHSTLPPSPDYRIHRSLQSKNFSTKPNSAVSGRLGPRDQSMRPGPIALAPSLGCRSAGLRTTTLRKILIHFFPLTEAVPIPDR